jgi:hypothetical protein
MKTHHEETVHPAVGKPERRYEIDWLSGRQAFLSNILFCG